jgi:hypothetical protein
MPVAMAIALPALLTNPIFWICLVPAGFLTLLFVTSLLERHPTRPFVPADRRPPPSPYPGPVALDYSADLPDPSQLPDYVRVMGDAAYAAGFVFGGILAHVKAPRVKVLATLWLSPSRDTLILSGSGTVWGMPHHQTWLYTPLKDGHILVTTDNNDEGEHSGLYKSRRVLNAPFDQLYAAHRARVEKAAGQADVYHERDAMSALLAQYDRRVKRLIERRVAYFVDPGGMWWRYTIKGAIKVVLGFFTQLAGALPQAWRVKRGPVASPNLK